MFFNRPRRSNAIFFDRPQRSNAIFFDRPRQQSNATDPDPSGGAMQYFLTDLGGAT
ncbi:hypothetical protein K443DRAFT_7920 [Laccaria amethystina LaAM-08-1]|uniref:Uncharacterized protein n=1 Tax=Laccaria amethystina LaAM-08-1 TaxID=1095629 RepID=A0A0C9XQX5_9AGAR|nr:hypothetical protein K443DRAFT_7920 [Laccaria amethystina LaAM-08-1]